MECMKERGWCPSTVTKPMDSPQLGLLTAYYVFTMDSTRIGDQSLHADCGTRLCRAHSVVLDGAYETRHVLSGCQFEMVGVNTSEVSRIISKGGTPLVEISEDSGGVALSVREGKADEMYTAISHVWSDGLGNPSHNALPQCQLSRLALQLRRFPDNERCSLLDARGNSFAFLFSPGEPRPARSIVTMLPGMISLETGKWQFIMDRELPNRPFWMDTLCIPVGEGDQVTRCKLKAIDRMNYVYSAAGRVLVLDPELLNTCLCASGMLETYARIAISPWFGRSWTFQEGIPANYIHFQFADDVVRLANSNEWLDWKQAQLPRDSSPEPSPEDILPQDASAGGAQQEMPQHEMPQHEMPRSKQRGTTNSGAIGLKACGLIQLIGCSISSACLSISSACLSACQRDRFEDMWDDPFDMMLELICLPLYLICLPICFPIDRYSDRLADREEARSHSCAKPPPRT